MSEHVAIALVNDERDQERKRCGVRPHLSLQQAGDEEKLDETVDDKISPCEQRGISRKVLDCTAEGSGNPVVRIFGQLRRCQ